MEVVRRSDISSPTSTAKGLRSGRTSDRGNSCCAGFRERSAKTNSLGRQSIWQRAYANEDELSEDRRSRSRRIPCVLIIAGKVLPLRATRAPAKLILQPGVTDRSIWPFISCPSSALTFDLHGWRSMGLVRADGRTPLQSLRLVHV